ncbi:hypothetical protein EXIGLDRAFT_579263, partial [Exidia glandulosa HHB12029]
PTAFDGDSSKGRAFIRQCWLHMQGKPEDFRTDNDKILFILSWMKLGAAAIWAGNVTQQFMDGDDPYPSLADFEADFARNFILTNKAGDAANKLDALEQGSRSVDDYITDFLSYSKQSGYGDVELQRKFKRGLNTSLLDSVYRLPSLPADLQELMAEASHLEQQWR